MVYRRKVIGKNKGCGLLNLSLEESILAPIEAKAKAEDRSPQYIIRKILEGLVKAGKI